MRKAKSSAQQGMDESARSVKPQRDLTTLRLDSSGLYRSTFSPAPLTHTDKSEEAQAEPVAENARPMVRRPLVPRQALITVLALLGLLWAVPAYIIVSARSAPDSAVTSGGLGSSALSVTGTPAGPIFSGGQGSQGAVAASPSTESNGPVPLARTPSPTRKPHITATRTATRTATPTATVTSTPPPPTDTPIPPTLTPEPTLTPIPPVPTVAPPTRVPVTQVYYRVRPGDNLITIAARYGTTVDAIMRANGLGSTMIYAGQTLVIPVRR